MRVHCSSDIKQVSVHRQCPTIYSRCVSHASKSKLRKSDLIIDERVGVLIAHSKKSGKG